MATRRLAHADRRTSILEAAAAAFAARGFDGARTLEIAQSAGVSEALLYRHFPSKQALYEAVLDHLAERQDHNFRVLELPEPSTRGLVECLWRYFEACVHGHATKRADVGQRILLLSLAGDGRHAEMIYARARAIGAKSFAAALAAARREGNLESSALDPRNGWSFLEHVGTMMAASRLTGRPVIPYAGPRATLVRDAVLFAGRGLGLKESALAAYAPRDAARTTSRRTSENRDDRSGVVPRRRTSGTTRRGS